MRKRKIEMRKKKEREATHSEKGKKIEKKMERRKKEEREALHSEKGRIEKKNELIYKEQIIEKKNIAKERRRKRKKERRRDLEKEPIHTKKEIERRKEIREEGRRMASFLESNSLVVRRKIEKGSVGICDSWFCRERPSHGEVVTHGETWGRIGNHRKE